MSHSGFYRSMSGRRNMSDEIKVCVGATLKDDLAAFTRAWKRFEADGEVRTTAAYELNAVVVSGGPSPFSRVSEVDHYLTNR